MVAPTAVNWAVALDFHWVASTVAAKAVEKVDWMAGATAASTVANLVAE